MTAKFTNAEKLFATLLTLNLIIFTLLLGGLLYFIKDRPTCPKPGS